MKFTEAVYSKAEAELKKRRENAEELAALRRLTFIQTPIFRLLRQKILPRRKSAVCLLKARAFPRIILSRTTAARFVKTRAFLTASFANAICAF